MAKLNQKKAKEVEKAESSFPLLDDGPYHLRLVKVDADGEGPAGPYWTWEFDVIEPGATGKQWINTSLSDKALWKMKETFDAFGVETNTDTDELCGQVVKGIITTRVIQEGARKGQPANQVDKLLPKDEEFQAPTNKVTDDIF